MNILTELVIKLRAENDYQTQQKMTESFRTAAVQANLIVDAMEAAIRSFATLMDSMAQKMTNLYFIGRETKTGVLNLQALGFAAKQTGSSVEELQATLQGFALRLREGPGFAHMLHSAFGVNVDKEREWGDILFDLIAKLDQLPEQRRLSAARQLGIPLHLLDAWTKYLEQARRMRAESFEIDRRLNMPGNVADLMRRYAEAMERLDMIFEKIRMKVMVTFIDTYGNLVKQFGDFLIAKGPEIARTIAAFVEGMGRAITSIKDFMKYFGLDLEKAETWRKVFIGLGAVLSMMLIPTLIRTISLLWSIVGLVTTYGAELAAFIIANPAVAATAAAVGVTGAASLYARKKGFTGLSELWGHNLRRYGNALRGRGMVDESDPRRGRGRGGSSGRGGALDSGAATRSTGTLAQNQQTAYQAARAEGLDDTAAKAFVANLSGESLAYPGNYHWDNTHMASGIAQWDPPRSAWIKEHYGAMPHQLPIATQVKAALHEMRENYLSSYNTLVSSNTSAQEKLHALVYDYERPADKAGDTAKRIAIYRGLDIHEGETATASWGGKSVAIGDSLAQGIGLAGAENRGIQGRHQQEILNDINNTPASALQGKHIFLSGGASNDRGDTSLIDKQLAALKAKGVDPNNITVVGVGSGGGGEAANARLRSAAHATGASFQPVPAGTDVHPSMAGYRSMLQGQGRQSADAEHMSNAMKAVRDAATSPAVAKEAAPGPSITKPAPNTGDKANQQLHSLNKQNVTMNIDVHHDAVSQQQGAHEISKATSAAVDATLRQHGHKKIKHHHAVQVQGAH